MGYFITRIELHEAVAADYGKLYESMRLQGFSRNIKGSDGKVYRLPTAQYRLESTTLKKSEVLVRAKRAAATIGKKFAAMVTEGLSTWDGLQEVNIAVKPAKKPSPSLARLAKMANGRVPR